MNSRLNVLKYGGMREVADALDFGDQPDTEELCAALINALRHIADLEDAALAEPKR